MQKSDEAVKAEEKVDAPKSDETTKTTKTTKKSKAKPSKGKTGKAAKAKKETSSKAGKKNAKKAAPKKAEKAKTPKKPKAEMDKFGFRKNSKKSQAAAIYATKRGATRDEIKEKIGSSQLNLLKEVEGKGFKVEKSKEKGSGKKEVTRYRIVT